jgi:signal transduction histidine kinase
MDRPDPATLPEDLPPHPRRMGILVVDDTVETLRMLVETLVADGHEVRPAIGGRQALDAASHCTPELILLDIHMPGIDGFETCRQLKAAPATASVPVIFLSSSLDADVTLRGFSVGAIDYISKPFRREELLARVRTHLELGRLRHDLERIVAERTRSLFQAHESLKEANSRLEARVRERTDQLERTNEELQTTLADLLETQKRLVEQEKVAALGGLVAGIAHELNTPLGTAMTTASLIRPELSRFHETKASRSDEAELEKFLERMLALSDLLSRSLDQAGALVRTFKQVAVSPGSYQLGTVHLSSWLGSQRVMLLEKAKARGHELRVECPGDLEIRTYPAALGQVIGHLVSNSLEHAFAEGVSGTVVLSARREPFSLVVSVRDDGLGLSEEALRRYFEPFYTSRRARGHLGLGAHIVHNLVVQLLQGRIEIRNISPGLEVIAHLPELEPAAK